MWPILSTHAQIGKRKIKASTFTHLPMHVDQKWKRIKNALLRKSLVV
jgi:hypothetical protein